MAKDLAKQYDPKDVADRTYKFGLDGNYFHAKISLNSMGNPMQYNHRLVTTVKKNCHIYLKIL